MARRKATVTKADIQRALEGAKAAGMTPTEYRITPAGEIQVFVGSQVDGPRSDVANEIDRHFRHGR